MIKEITASLGRTLQIAPFEPLNFHASVKIELAEGESVEEAFVEAKKIVKDQVAKEIDVWKNTDKAVKGIIKERQSTKDILGF